MTATQTPAPSGQAPAAASSPAPGAAPPPTRPSRRWLRWVAGVVVALLCVVAMLVVLAGGSKGGASDPRNRGDAGTAALVALLGDEGVTVSVHDATTAPSALGGSTVVLSGAYLGADGLARVLDQRPARVVLLGYGSDELTAAGIPVRDSLASGALREPGCAHPVATAAGSVVVEASLGYVPGTADPRPEQACYGSADGRGSAFLEYVLRGVAVDVVAGGLANDDLRSVGGVVRGNAAFGLRLLGQQPELVWWVVSAPPDAAGGGNLDAPSLVPARVGLFLLATVPLLFVVAVWRGRRLGPILTERLPVVVPASETVEGHGRLYHRLKAYDTAAVHLRRGTVDRLARRFGTPDTEQLVGIVADCTTLSAQDVAHALTGPAPQTETDLWNLRNTLARIEQEARS